jgi:hypothetical protein
LWSWRNLTITAVLVLALLAGLGRLTDGMTPAAASPAPPKTADASPTVPTPSPITTTQPSTSAPTTTASAPPPKISKGSPVEVATAFVTAWATTGSGEQAWLAGMRPWATPDLVESMAGTDPAQVPATKVTGDAALRATRGDSATVSVPTDGGRIAVELVRQAGAWKATTLAPDDAPPGAPTPSLGPAASSTGG